MKKNEIRVDGVYVAKVSGKLTRVRVDAIRQVPKRHGNSYSSQSTYVVVNEYDVTNLSSGRKLVFRSSAKFRYPANNVTIVQ